LRHELGYADYLGALQRYRDEYPRDPHVLHLSPYLIDYPFANRLYPESLDVIERLKELGQVAILSDGDVVFQPRKVDRSGLTSAVDDNVLIYVHKEQSSTTSRPISSAALRRRGRQVAHPGGHQTRLGRSVTQFFRARATTPSIPPSWRPPLPISPSSASATSAPAAELFTASQPPGCLTSRSSTSNFRVAFGG
jgi:hypothetical protein